VVQIHPPQPILSNTWKCQHSAVLLTSTETSTKSVWIGPENLRRATRVWHINGSPTGLKNHPLVCVRAIQRQEIPVEGCRSVTMQNLFSDVSSPLLTERQAAQYLLRSKSSLRRDRKRGYGPGFLRIGRSVRYLKAELDGYICACRTSAGIAEVGRG
jgi:hypothetical protein